MEDLTIEIVLRFRIPRSLGPINSGPNSVETLCFLFVSCLLLTVGLISYLSNTCDFFAEIMLQESPAGADVLDAYRKWAVERKGCQSIDALPTTKGSNARGDKGSVGPSHKSKKRVRDGGNIATTTRSPGCRYRHHVGTRSRWTHPHRGTWSRRLHLLRPTT